jgi:hypothetical protein
VTMIFYFFLKSFQSPFLFAAFPFGCLLISAGV